MTAFPNSFFRSNPASHWQMYIKEVQLDRTPTHDNAGASPPQTSKEERQMSTKPRLSTTHTHRVIRKNGFIQKLDDMTGECPYVPQESHPKR